MVLTLERTEEIFIPGSYEYYCYGQQCLAPVKSGDAPFRTSDDTLRLDPNSYGVGDAPFTVYMDSASSGTALYKYTFRDKLNTSNTADIYIRWVIIDNSSNGPNFQLRDSSGNDITGDTITFNALYNDLTNQSFVQTSFLRFYNNTPAQQNISLFRSEGSTITDSYDQFCFGSTCSPLLAEGSNRFYLSNDSILISGNNYHPIDTIFSVRLDSAKSGEAIYTYNFSDKLNKNNIATIYVRWIVVDVTSINEAQYQNEFSLYPNPSSDLTTINLEKPLVFRQQEVEIYNILGEEVRTEQIASGSQIINLNVNDLTPGVYFVNIIGDGHRVASKKMIVK